MLAGRTCMRRILPVLAAILVPAAAQAAEFKAQVPGYYRIAVGDVEVTALYDGYVAIKAGAFHGMPEKQTQGLLAKEFLSNPTGVPTAVNAYLVQTADRLIMVDAGSSRCFGPTAGRLPDNIRAAGYAPEAVDVVLITHMHGDHVCGLVTPDGKRAFPNAAVWTAQEEADYWFGIGNKIALDSLAPYRAAGTFHTFRPGEQILPGVTAIPTHGHTPGHTSYLFSSKSDNLLIWGDIVHNYAVQFPHPEAFIASDVDPKQAVATRKALFEEIAAKGWSIAGAHLPFPGIGHLRKDGRAYAWVPVEYGPVAGER